jgi:hypothetical protein
MHRLFQKSEEDRIMEGDFDPAEEREKWSAAAAKPPAGKPGRVVLLWRSLFSRETARLRRKDS